MTFAIKDLDYYAANPDEMPTKTHTGKDEAPAQGRGFEV